MRVFGRVVYALLAVFTFWFVLDYARGAMTINYFENEGAHAVEIHDDIFFYGSARDYNQRTALFETDSLGYTVSMYEIADANTRGQEIVVSSYIYIMLKSDDLMNQVFYLRFSNGTDQLDVEFMKFRTLNIMMGLNDLKTEFGIAKETILEKNYNEIMLLDQYKNTIFTKSISLEESDFIIEGRVTSYYEQNDRLPLTELIDFDIYPAFTHEMDAYINILWISLITYLVILILSTYIVFFAKKKFLGKKKPSDILIKEQSNYKKSGS
ncbi:MAG: hypothetical protein Q7I99_07120 [Acholeplasmataceae bacterium]|nr:hypothetical protein [Acholeplasmataceae bacterium]